jgi:2-haloalkanoic acid dehalogenase type II
MKRPLTDYRALSFDCYGTLIDWETGIWDAFGPLLSANRTSDIARKAILETFGRLEAEHQARTPGLPYRQVLSQVHEASARHFGLATTDELDVAFGESVPHWPAFADTPGALRHLKQHYRLVILSNVDRKSFAASNRKLGVEFDAVYTAEEIGSYKPDPANFRYMLSRIKQDFGLQPTDLLHTAQSLFHDHVPAIRLGLSSAWIDRQRLSEGGEWGATARVEDRPSPDYVFLTLTAMVDHRRQSSIATANAPSNRRSLSSRSDRMNT